MSAAVAVDARVTARHADLQLTLKAGTIAALVGPNGAGKSTLLQLISGQLRPDAGSVHLDGRLVSGPGVHVPVHRRRIALLEQRPLLFEHLTVADNVAFGPRARGVRRREALHRARRELEAVGCGDLATQRSWEVSGGQAQRIALARALATDPSVVLLDEPMAALDASVAPAVRGLLRERLRGEERTALLVTHDAIDALSLADVLVVIEDGRVVDLGPVADQLARPRRPFLAELVDVNLLHGRITATDSLTLATGEPVFGVPAAALTPGTAGFSSFPPASVAVHAQEPTGSPRNHLRARIVTAEPRGPLVRVGCELSDRTPLAADVTVAAAVDGELHPGRQVWLAVKAAQVSLYPR